MFRNLFLDETNLRYTGANGVEQWKVSENVNF